VLLLLGGCGGPAASNPDAGNGPVQDAAPADVPGSPTDATDVALFPPAIWTDRKGAATVTARVFASLDEAGSARWLRVGKDGSLFVYATADSSKATFYDAGGPSALWGTLPSLNFIVHLDRQANTSWVFGYTTDANPPVPAMLPDGALVIAALPEAMTTAAAVVSRLEADGTMGWSVNFGPTGIYFAGLAPTPDGDVILVGTAFANVDLDPGPGTVVRAKQGPFVMKLSGATGALQWVQAPVDSMWIAPNQVMVRADGRIVVDVVSASDKQSGGLVLLAANGTSDAASWLRFISGSFVSWVLLPDQNILAATPPPNAPYAHGWIRLLDGTTGKDLASHDFEGSYDALAAGPARVVGEQILRYDVNGVLQNFWGLDWWSPAGALEGGFQFPLDVTGAGTNQAVGGLAVDANGHVVVAVTIHAPAGATLDVDPGPGVSTFVTPNAGAQLAIIELAP
jgi:hypothetical protein